VKRLSESPPHGRRIPLIYAFSIFLGAFLLFQVQPMLGKAILPMFGGSNATWMACMLFFQLLLLGGYAYAHLLVRWIGPSRQGIVHLARLVARSPRSIPSGDDLGAAGVEPIISTDDFSSIWGVLR
jgi:hypothetical protein